MNFLNDSDAENSAVVEARLASITTKLDKILEVLRADGEAAYHAREQSRTRRFSWLGASFPQHAQEKYHVVGPVVRDFLERKLSALRRFLFR